MYHSTRDIMMRAANSLEDNPHATKLYKVLVDAAQLRWMVCVTTRGGFYVTSRHAILGEALDAGGALLAFAPGREVQVINDLDPTQRHQVYAPYIASEDPAIVG